MKLGQHTDGQSDDSACSPSSAWTMDDLARELAATKKTLGTLIVWLNLELLDMMGAQNTSQLERERDEARRIATDACALLAENNFEVNYPPMPWDSESPENV